MTAPAYAFKVGRIVEQGQVAFMRFDVMNDRCAGIRASVRKGYFAPLASVAIARQDRAAQLLPAFGVVQFAIFISGG